MTQETVRTTAAKLRAAGEALRRRSTGEVCEVLGAVLERWRDPASPERLRLEQELPKHTDFSPEGVREGLKLGLEPWSVEAWRELVSREVRADSPAGAPLTSVLLAGSIPLPTLLGILAPLAVRSPVLVKTATRDPLTAYRVAESLAAIDATLADCVAVVSFESADTETLDAFLEAECIVATGSDASVEAVATRAPHGCHLLRHGHGASLAVLGTEATHGEALAEASRGIALDTALWDQQGCLSPQAVFVAADTEACRRVAAALAHELEEIGRRLPRGALDARRLALEAHERSTAELRAAAGQAVEAHTGEAWTVIRESDAAPRAIPTSRFLRVHPLRVAALESDLAAWAPHLAAAALAGFGPAAPEIQSRLETLGATRVCEPGTLQTPPLAWPRDGLPVLASLLSG